MEVSQLYQECQNVPRSMPIKVSSGVLMEQTMEPWTSDQDLDLRGYAAQALVTAFIFNSVAAWVGAFPGHGAGGFWPIYVPDPSGPLTSQHLFDPYSFVHFGHGIISWYLWGDEGVFRPLLQDGFPGKDLNGGNPKSKCVEASRARRWGRTGGQFMTLFMALIFEHMENTELVINMFRENSGTSLEYRGDSAVNVFGDLVSCSLGYNLSRFLGRKSSQYWLPMIVFVVIEGVLLYHIRDNMLLIIVQMLFGDDRIKTWQEGLAVASKKEDGEEEEEVIARVDVEDPGPEVKVAGYWKSKFVSKKYSKYQQSFFNETTDIDAVE